jgi:hypothetical protein
MTDQRELSAKLANTVAQAISPAIDDGADTTAVLYALQTALVFMLLQFMAPEDHREAMDALAKNTLAHADGFARGVDQVH